MKHIRLLRLSVLGFCALTSASAMAHVGDHSLSSWTAGLVHPILGIDHLLALIAAGFCLAQQGKSKKAPLVIAFLMLLGIGMALGLQLSAWSFEPGIPASMLALGILLAFALKLRLLSAVLVLGLVALVHGFVHGTELPEGQALHFSAGLLISSGLILITSSILAAYTQTMGKGVLGRILGMVVASFAILS